jgi:ubiquinone/menaquinone biosynthesis C-methylase UbiE
MAVQAGSSWALMAVTPDNRDIYNRNYSGSECDLGSADALTRGMVAMRSDYVRRFGHGRDVLDLCCGTGSYLLPDLGSFRSAVAVDFSSNMLDGLRARLPGPHPENLTILEEDAAELSLPDASVDFAWSWTALYYVPDLGRVLAQVARVLRPGGIAVLEVGNRWSVNTLVSNVQHRDSGWAKPYYVPYGRLRRLFPESGLRVKDWRSFQLINSYGTPRSLLPLTPITTERWRPVLSRKVRGRMVDERIASAGPLRRLAFRHVVVARRDATAR